MMQRRKAFSLFGIMIVVMVLGVVAAVVAPRFSEAGIRESRMDELCQMLQLLRSQIELYKVQHEGHPPMQAADGTIVFDPEFEQMTYCTDMDGQIKRRKPRTAREGVWQFGPYLERIPENPFNRSRTIVRVRHEDDIPGVGDAGWAYMPESGQIYANDSIQHAGL
jgi:general secretion pathway protein G